MTEPERLQEQHRLAHLLKGVVRGAEKCMTPLREGFINSNDYDETRKTIERLDVEIKKVHLDIENNLNSGEKDEGNN